MYMLSCNLHLLLYSVTLLILMIFFYSLETVEQDVKDTNIAVDKIDQRLTGNEETVAVLSTQVEQQGADIQELGEGLDTVQQRVDLAEKDIEETKIKVEEVDMKVCYTNLFLHPS